MYFKEYIFFLRNTQLNFMFLFSPDTDGRPGSDRQVVVINEQLGTLDTLDGALKQSKVRLFTNVFLSFHYNNNTQVFCMHAHKPSPPPVHPHMHSQTQSIPPPRLPTPHSTLTKIKTSKTKTTI